MATYSIADISKYSIDKELMRLLTHPGLPAEFPKFRPAAQASLYEHACGPPDEDCQLDPRVDYEAIEPAPADH